MSDDQKIEIAFEMMDKDGDGYGASLLLRFIMPGRDADPCESRGERGQAGELSPAVGRKGPELILDSVNGNLSNSGVQGHGNAPPSPPRTAGRCPPRPSDDERKSA